MFLDNLSHIFTPPLNLKIAISTWDSEVIGRENDVFSFDLLKKAADIGRNYPIVLKNIKGSFIIEDFHKLLKNEAYKYDFLARHESYYKSMMQHIESIEIPEKIFTELTWLKNNYMYNYHHMLGVMGLMTRISMDFICKESEIKDAIEAALLCDMGMGRISLDIIRKDLALTKEERRIISLHPIYSALLTAYYYQDSEYPAIKPVIEHNENLDKSGTPRGISSDYLISNILRASDMFDGLISERPFRKFYSVKEAFEICEKEIEAGKIIRDVFPLLYYYHQDL